MRKYPITANAISIYPIATKKNAVMNGPNTDFLTSFPTQPFGAFSITTAC